ncbi:MAG: hypothetical protein FJ217_07480 [Ignavibacteria bacterium]|nr:hypothetical protein [Ignavibacteria bacterium]
MQQSRSTFTRGTLYVVLAVLFWGNSAALAKYLFLTRYDPLIITQTRVSLSFIMLTAYFLFVNRDVFRVPLRALSSFALVGVIGIASTNYTYYYTVKESTVATAILIQNAAPVLVMVYAVLIAKEEEFNVIKMLALLLALGGCYFAVSGGSLRDVKLSGWALLTGPASMLTYAFMLLASKRVLREYPVWTMLVYALGFATLFWLLVNPPWAIAAKGYALEDWGIFVVFAVLSILTPYIFFINGLKLLEASTAGVITTLEPVVAIAVAYVALGETLTSIQLLGAVGVVCAILLLQVQREYFYRLLRRREHAD